MGCSVIILTISELGRIARTLILATAHYNIRKPNWQFPARRENILKSRRESTKAQGNLGFSVLGQFSWPHLLQ